MMYTKSMNMTMFVIKDTSWILSPTKCMIFFDAMKILWKYEMFWRLNTKKRSKVLKNYFFMKYSEFNMVDNKSIMTQLDELYVFVSILKDLKIKISKPIQVVGNYYIVDTT